MQQEDEKGEMQNEQKAVFGKKIFWDLFYLAYRVFNFLEIKRGRLFDNSLES